MKALVYITYRQYDSGAEASLIASALRRTLGDDEVVMDSSMDHSKKWPLQLRCAVGDARYLLVIIGPHWLRAASDAGGQRRIDREADWVRQEIAYAFKDSEKIILPLLVNGGCMPQETLPADISGLSSKKSVEVRSDFWDEDITSLIALIHGKEVEKQELYSLNDQKLKNKTINSKLVKELIQWQKKQRIKSSFAESGVELYRQFEFVSFRRALDFMGQAAAFCESNKHYPRWENEQELLRVYLSTWDVGQLISERDIELARFLDELYGQFQ